MLYPVDPPNFYGAPIEADERMLSLSTDPFGELLATVSSSQLHVWSTSPHVAHLLSRDLPGTHTGDEDDGQLVLWGPGGCPTTVVVATHKRLLFFTVNVVINSQRFLQVARTRDSEPYVPFLDSAPDVSLMKEQPIDSGSVVGLAPAGPQAFFVWTTSGTLFVVGWTSQKVLHRWNTAELNLSRHAIHVSSSSPEPSPLSRASPSTAATIEREVHTAAVDTTPPPGALGTGSRTTAHPPGPGTVVRRRATETPEPVPSSLAHETSQAPCTQSQSRSGEDITTSTAHAEGSADDGSKRSSDTQLSGIIVDAAYSVSLKLVSLVFSSGQVVLAATSCGTRFEEAGAVPVTLSGSLLQPAADEVVTRVRLNGRHLLAAVASQDGRVACYGLVQGTQPRLSGAPLWKGLSCVEEARARCGTVEQLEWDKTEEMLCVAYTRFKMLVVEFSGVCTLNTAVSAAPRSTSVTATAGVNVVNVTQVDDDDDEASCVASAAPLHPIGGCAAFTWQTSGPDLFVVPTDARGGVVIGRYPLCRVISAAEAGGPSPQSCLPPVLLLGAHTLMLPTAENMERYYVPHHMMGENYPLCYGAISADGHSVACAGKGGGVILFSRSSRHWEVIQRANTADQFRCVADPVWLHDRLAAVPTRNHTTRAHAILAYSGLMSGDAPTEPLASIPMADGQQLLAVTATARTASAGGFLVAYTRQQHVFIYRYQIFADDMVHPTQLDITFSLTRHLELGEHLRWPLAIQPVASATRTQTTNTTTTARAVGKKPSPPHLLFHSRHTHSLVWCHAQTKTPVGFEPQSAGARPDEPLIPAVVKESNLWTATPFRTRSGALAVVRGFWFDCGTPLDGLTLLTAESEGTFIYHVASVKVGTVPQVHRSLVALDAELDSAAVGPVTRMARLLCLPSGGPQVRSYLLHLARLQQAAPAGVCATPHSGSVLAGEQRARLVPYGHRVLTAVLGASLPNVEADDVAPVRGSQAASFPWETRLFFWVERLRRASQLVPTADSFLRTVMEEHPPAGLRHVTRRAALRATVRWLRHYPEFHEIVVGCLRKLDMSNWHFLLDLVGSPEDLYLECVSTGQLAVAVHLVRVMLLSSFRPAEPSEPDKAAKPGDVTSTSPALSRASSSAGVECPPGAVNGAVILREAVTPAGIDKSVRHTCELFALEVTAGDYTQAYELLRFLALLRYHVSLPVMEPPREGEGHFREQEFFKRTIRNSQRRHTPATAVSLDVAAAPAFAFDVVEAEGEGPSVVEGSTVPRAEGLDKEEEQQRRDGLRALFEHHPEVCAAIDTEATRLLHQGRLRRMVQLLTTFSLSVQFFIVTKLHADQATGSAKTPLSLHAALIALHDELGLPLAPRMLSPLEGAVAEKMETACGGDFVRTLMHDADLMTTVNVWSLPQYVVFSSPRILLALIALSRLFADHTVYALALSTLLMAQADVIALIVPRTRASTRVGSDEVHWVSLLASLPRTAPLSGYLGFVESVIHSIPPNALRNIQ